MLAFSPTLSPPQTKMCPWYFLLTAGEIHRLPLPVEVAGAFDAIKHVRHCLELQCPVLQPAQPPL